MPMPRGAEVALNVIKNIVVKMLRMLIVFFIVLWSRTSESVLNESSLEHRFFGFRPATKYRFDHCQIALGKFLVADLLCYRSALIEVSWPTFAINAGIARDKETSSRYALFCRCTATIRGGTLWHV